MAHFGFKCDTVIPIIFEGQFQVFQLFSSSKLVLKAVKSCFVALNYNGNGSKKEFDDAVTFVLRV